MIDIKLKKNNQDYYDISFNDDGDFEQVDNFDTSILLSLYTDKRADSSEVSEAVKRRGYIADQLYTSFKHGSKLWLLDQSRLNINVRNLAKTYTSESLQWLIDDSYLDNIEVKTDIINNENININIFAKSVNNKNIWSYSLWQNTGN